MKIPPFYIGQKVVCIQNHSQGLVKKGVEYTILDIQKGCKHHSWIVDVDHPKNLFGTGGCAICGVDKTETAYYICHSLFAPIEEQKFSKVTYTQVLEEVEMCNN
jgi:hypothetical protein